MDFPTPTGTGRVFYEGAHHDVTWTSDSDPRCGYMKEVTFPNGDEIMVTDYDDRLDFNFDMSDSGDEYYNVMVLLKPGEPDFTIIPTEAELRSDLFDAMKPFMEAVFNDVIHADDLPFCKNLFTIPACIIRTVQKTGSVDLARKWILKRVFEI